MSINRQNIIKLSPLGFGCAPVMGRIGKKHSLRAMSEAFDLGVTHFDVARSYGFGSAENIVGFFAKGQRDKVTITSKFGIVPPDLSITKKQMIAVARNLARVFPDIQGQLKKKSGKLLSERRFDVSYAKECLTKSLSELSSDYIDIYLIHEPDLSFESHREEVVNFLKDSVIAGYIKQWGFAYGTINEYDQINDQMEGIVQCEGNTKTLHSFNNVNRDNKQIIVTRPFSGGQIDDFILNKIINKYELLGIFNECSATFAELQLCIAHKISGENGSVLCSMFSSEHILSNVMAIYKLETNKHMRYLVDKIFKELIKGNVN